MQDDFVLWTGSTNTYTPTGVTPVPDPLPTIDYRIDLTNLRISLDKTIVRDNVFNNYYNNLKLVPEIPFTRNLVRSYPKAQGVSDLGYRHFIQEGWFYI